MARSRPTSAAHLLRPSALLAALCLAGMPAGAEGLHGRLEVGDAAYFAKSASLDAALGARDRNDVLGNVRFTWSPTWDRWSFDLQYVAAVDEGGNALLARKQAALYPAPPPTWFNLTNTFEAHGQLTASQTIDRLSLGYATSDTVVRVGRQALTWGSGFVFRPMDLFDPFAPTATDTEYKPGTDMLYSQFLFADGSDLQMIAVPRPTRKGDWPSTNASSFAAHLHTVLFGYQTTWLVARDHGDWVTGLGANGSLGGASWNLEVVPTLLRRGPTRLSALANISDAFMLFDRNATAFAEYFHNGFGVTGGAFDLASLPEYLADRLRRGQVFNSRQNYLAAGMSLEVTPLFTVSPTMIGGLDDASASALVTATYSLSDDLTLVAGAQAPLGPAETEFGGMPISQGLPTLFAPPGQVFLQVRQYF